MPGTTEIEATYQVVTPLFCGGADQQPEVRLASFKGVLRFWWRAAAWARHRGDPAAVGDEEAALFGSAADGKGHGRSRVRLSMPSPDTPSPLPAAEELGKKSARAGAHYLAYGMVPQSEHSGSPRHCLPAPFSFTVQARYRPRTHARDDEARQQLESLVEALETVGLVGGLGARSRKGFGSLVLTGLTVGGEERAVPADSAGVVRALQTRATGGRPQSPGYTAFSPRAEHLILAGPGRGIPLLDTFGQALKTYVGDVAPPVSKQRVAAHRASFGLPRHVGPQGEQRMAPARRYDRRASPLFVHVHEFRERPVLVLSFLPSRFLPDDASGVAIGKETVFNPADTETEQPVREFLDRLRGEWTVLADTRAQEGAR